MMLYRSPEGSFIIYSTVNSTAPRKCLHVQPGVVDFPGRCDLLPGHTGDHTARVAYVGPSCELFTPERWENDDA